MPAIRRKNSDKSTSLQAGETTPSKGWTKGQKAQLFYHVIKNGEKDFKFAVEGKTGQQALEQWK